MKYNVYRIKETQKDNGRIWDSVDTHHKLILVDRFDTFGEAEEWLKNKHEKYVNYTILPVYYFTHYDEE